MANNTFNFEPYYRGAHHMVDNDLFEPQRTNNFEIRFEGLEKLVSANGKYTYEDCGKAITLSTANVGDLGQSIDAIAVQYGNNAIKFAGKPTLNNISVTVNDFVGLETERILEAWSALVYNKVDQTVGKATAYKHRGYLIEYTSDYKACKVWQLEGCWPGTITYGGYSQDGNAIRQITFDLNIDFAIPLDKASVVGSV